MLGVCPDMTLHVCSGHIFYLDDYRHSASWAGTAARPGVTPPVLSMEPLGYTEGFVTQVYGKLSVPILPKGPVCSYGLWDCGSLGEGLDDSAQSF